jgi:hypothetical protein
VHAVHERAVYLRMGFLELFENLNVTFLLIKIWLIERFDVRRPDAWGNGGSQTPAEPVLYSYIVNAVVLFLWFHLS